MSFSSSLSTLQNQLAQRTSELNLKTEKLLHFRLALAGCGLLLALCLWFFSPSIGASGVNMLTTSGVIVACLAYTGAALILVKSKTVSTFKNLKVLNACLAACDVATITYLVSLTNGLESDLYVLYLVPILLASYTFERRGVDLTALLVSVSYVGLLVWKNADSISYAFSGDQVGMASVYVRSLWARIAGRSILLIGVAFVWARFCGYMSGLASQVANQLREQLEQNNRMVLALQEQSERERLINGINSVVRSPVELNEILKTVCNELSVAMKVFRCAIVCPNPKHEKLLITEAGDDENIDPLDQSSTHFNFELLEYLLENHSFYETREDGSIQKSFVYYKPENDADLFPVRELLVAAQMGSMVIQPIIYRGSSKGIIIVAETDPRRKWAESELELVKAVAGQVAVAVEQSSLIEALHKINEDLLQKNINLDTKNVQIRAVQSQMIHQEKMASLGRLVAGIAHELNNPINFVHGNLPYLKEYVEDLKKLVDSIDIDKLPEDQQRKLKELKEIVKYDFLVADLDNIIADLNEGADRIRTIIRNLRSFSRLDEAELKEASIHDGLDSSLKILSQYYGSHLITINKDYSELPPVMCNPGQLNQVWMNILANAAQAVEAKEHGIVDIKTTLDNGLIVVTISDNGTGIKPEIQSKIFDPFFTTKPVGQGTGLGLSICHSIIERHGGQIELDSKMGQGTRFTIRIPAKLSMQQLKDFSSRSIYDSAP
ncbi:MAG: HAMP domain-containing histidine kinase [Cyanobacteria bacterium TGS_CYA1]|nr:HAMP domain-containing histidine kinase [Cyanobacteria bacterium TGS_CYA1]